MITLDQIKEFSYRYIIHDSQCKNWRINGKTQWWKKDPYRVLVPLKFGLYNYGYLSSSNLKDFHIISEENCRKKE